MRESGHGRRYFRIAQQRPELPHGVRAGLPV